jgi:hypothetical protein
MSADNITELLNLHFHIPQPTLGIGSHIVSGLIVSVPLKFKTYLVDEIQYG